MSRLTLYAAAILLTGCASTGSWSSFRVDASSQESFEESVAWLQRELPYYRSQRFTLALAAIWMADVSEATGGDVDHDGDVDDDDVRTWLEFPFALQSGAPALPIDDSEDGKGTYAAKDFYRQFDGLGYKEILSLADPRIVQRYSAYLMRRSQEQNIRSERLGGQTKPYFPPPVDFPGGPSGAGQ